MLIIMNAYSCTVHLVNDQNAVIFPELYVKLLQYEQMIPSSEYLNH